MHALGNTNSNTIAIDVEGGKLKVSFEKTNAGYENVKLEGPATFVFEGEIEI
jgi:diaminopimelate epimerase